MNDRTAQDLNRIISRFGVPADVTSTDDGVLIPARTAQELSAKLGFVQGGSRVPFVRTLLRANSVGQVFLRGDEGMHLRRALEDIHREDDRRQKLDRGQLPGALSGAEVSYLARRHPHLFTGRR